MFLKKLLFCCFLAISLLSTQSKEVIDDHAIYISVIKVAHDKLAPTATIHMRVFADDLKSALRNKFGYEAISEKETFCADYEGYINKYFEKKFLFSINQENITYHLINCQRTDDVYQLEFEMVCPDKWQKVQIEAPFFMELFPNQSNVIHLEDSGNKRFGRTTKGNEILKIRL